MRNTLLTLICLLLLFGCSTSPNDNGGTNTTVIPIAPSNLTGIVISGAQINLSWTDNSTNETGFKIQRKTSGGNFTDVGSTGSNFKLFNDLGLTNNTAYTYRVYAYNSAGNSLLYSNELTITPNNISQVYSYTSGPNVTDINGNTYQSFTNSCGQTWTKMNLNVNCYRDGSVIPQVTNASQWANLTTGAWCWYKNDSLNNWQYGKLYNWYAINDPRGLAPQGWHIPSETDWNKLVRCIDTTANTITGNPQSSTAGGSMKEVGLSHWANPNLGATNISGFTGLPGDYRSYDGSFSNTIRIGAWWSSTQSSATNAWNRGLGYYTTWINRGSPNKANGASVRLVKD